MSVGTDVLAAALQSPFHNVWLADGQIPECDARGHRVYSWNYDGWQVFQHGDQGEARLAYLWDMRKPDSHYTEGWHAMIERVREWTDEIHAYEEERPA